MRLGFKLCVRLTQGFCVRREAEQRRICPGAPQGEAAAWYFAAQP